MERMVNNMMKQSSLVTLHSCLARFSRRLRLRDGWRLLQRTVWLACLASLLIQLGGRRWPIPQLDIWTLVPLVIWLLAVIAITLLHPQHAMQTARRVDAELDLKERLATALLLEAMVPPVQPPDAVPHAVPHAALITQQRADAIAVAQDIVPSTAFPLRWLWRPWLAAGVLIAAIMISTLLPNPMDQLLATRAAVAQAIQTQAEKIDEVREKVAEAQALSPAEKDELRRQLDELADQLRANAGDRAEALADFSALEESLREKSDTNLAARQNALDALSAQLQALAESQSMSASDITDAAEALAQLAESLSDMDESTREAVAQSLAQLAGSAAQSGNAELAQTLAALAQSMQAGDGESAAQAAANAAQTMANSQSDLAAQAQLQQTLDQVQASRQAVAQAGQNGATAAANDQANQSGQGQNPSQGQNQGQGQNPGAGQGQGQGQNAGSGSGAQANTLPPRTSSGQSGRFQGENELGRVDTLDQQVYVPRERRANTGAELFIPGQDTGQGETQVREQRDPLPGAANPALIPYQEVYYDYLDAAQQTMERSTIPPGLQGYVRDYFSQLEP